MQKFFGFLMAVWICGVSVAAPYYNWQYAQENGFLKWLLLGEIVATGRAAAWPYFLLSRSNDTRRVDGVLWSNEEIDNARHFFRALEASQRATRRSNAVSPGTLTDDDITALLSDGKEALTEAQMVRDDVLEKACPGMSTRFRTKFQRGLELQVRNLEVRDTQGLIEGVSLDNEWGDWYTANRTMIVFPKLN